jgi:PhnB protein
MSTPDENSAWPAVVPMPTYEDVGKASDWLCSAFGFREQQRFTDASGRVTTTILQGPVGGVVMLGWSGPSYQGPARHRQTCEAAERWQAVPFVVDGVLVTVNDVDQHWAQARAAGAVMLTEPEDSSHGRSYRVEDLEGHRWMFSE